MGTDVKHDVAKTYDHRILPVSTVVDLFVDRPGNLGTALGGRSCGFEGSALSGQKTAPIPPAAESAA